MAESRDAPARPGAQVPTVAPVQFEPLFAPRAVAVAGVSSGSTAQGNAFIRRLREAGFGGDIYPIHPTASTLEGLAAYPTLSSAPRPVDYAFIAVPAAQVPGLLANAQGRVRFAQVMSSGFGESGVSEAALLEAARTGGMRLLGPNCMGTYSPRGRLNFLDGGIGPPGTIGVLSQSGGLSIDIVRHGRQRGLAFSAVVSLGNSLDLGPNDLIEHFLQDPSTRVIGAYLEDVRDGRRLFRILSAAGARKPVVILRGGRSRQGQRAAHSHTGSLASPQEAWRALASQTGAVLRDSLEDFVAALLAFQAYPAPTAGSPSERVVLLGNGGGASVLAADSLADRGLAVAPLDDACAQALAMLPIPPGASLGNPIDVPANSLQRERGVLVQRILEAVGTLERPGALLVHLNLPVILGYRHLDMLGDLEQAIVASLPAIADGTRLAVCLRSCGDQSVELRRRELGQRLAGIGVPVFETLDEAAGALAALHEFSAFRHSRSVGCARRRDA
ncbi:MAG: CoA-binding protein [Lautropia sp.]